MDDADGSEFVFGASSATASDSVSGMAGLGCTGTASCFKYWVLCTLAEELVVASDDFAADVVAVDGLMLDVGECNGIVDCEAAMDSCLTLLLRCIWMTLRAAD